MSPAHAHRLAPRGPQRAAEAGSGWQAVTTTDQHDDGSWPPPARRRTGSSALCKSADHARPAGVRIRRSQTCL